MPFHDLAPPYFEKLSGGRIRLRLRSPWKCQLRWAPDGEEEFLNCRKVEAPPGFAGQWWEVLLRPQEHRLHYRFRLWQEQRSVWLSALGLTSIQPLDDVDFTLNLDDPGLDWLAGQVFYQIFPDRFASSGFKISPLHQVDGESALARDWGEVPDSSCGWREFYGGDLDGLRSRMDYLRQLGVTGLYLNPIFTAPSNHRYDTANYHEVDPHLGGEPAFRALLEELRQAQMRVVLDVVPNHCGQSHPWFVSACQGGPEREYFTFHAQGYECWKGHTNLPKLNYQSQRLRDVMYRRPDSVLQRWLDTPYQLDGWRLDVANMWARQGKQQLQEEILRELRQHLKDRFPDSYLLGENFFDATGQLQGDQLDGSMNYRGFLFPLLEWLKGGLSSQDFWAEWLQVRAHLPSPQRHQMWNLLGSHDTERIATRLPQRSQREAAFTALFTFPGVACLYYGDEIPLRGGADPKNRACMPWEKALSPGPWWRFVQGLVQLRKSHSWLHQGAVLPMVCPAGSLIYLRSWGKEHLLVALRLEQEYQLDLQTASLAPGGHWVSWPSGQVRGQSESLLLGPASWQIWTWKSP